MGPTGSRQRLRAVLVSVAAIAAVTGATLGVSWWRSGAPLGQRLSASVPADRPGPSFVGQKACRQCHEQVAQRWQGSHHDLAMQPATEATVAGDFSNARFTYAGVTSIFFRRDGTFVTRTDGPDGAPGEYEIKYTFGVAPLQQYLVELPGGRLQALGIAWDTRTKAQGGQRWFHLYPGQNVTYRHPLHWTAPSQNWNYMCADCHSTGVRKNYDAATRSFATRYAEVNVACEACHGPGSDHVAWARKEGDWRRAGATKGLAVALDERKAVVWAISAESGNAQRTPAGRPSREIETCGRCHARRGQFADGDAHGRPLGDAYRVALLEDSLYHPDGQIRDEVYEYGSFVQSKMFERGVTCSDCHDPHTGKLRAPGSQVCGGCHASARYETQKHHFHAAGSRGADCVGCHMPVTTYMVVDPRHDHSLRVPRPDLSVKLGVPNACTRCHADRPAEWAARQVETWYGHTPRGYQRYGGALASASVGAPGAADLLVGVVRDAGQPAIARATALQRLGDSATAAAFAAAQDSVRDSDPLVRRAAVSVLERADPARRSEFLAPLLDDAVRAVRMEAARALAAAPRDRLTATERAALERGLGEYLAGERFNAERPESYVNLGVLYTAQRRLSDAEIALRTALDLSPSFAPASVNLADLYRASGRDGDAERVLRAALARDPRSAPAHHALGLLLVRERRMPEALAELEVATRLAPESARYGYVYAVALHETRRVGPAIEELARVLARHPYDRETLAALAGYTYQLGNTQQAVRYARRLAEIEPASPDVQQLVKRLETETRR